MNRRKRMWLTPLALVAVFALAAANAAPLAKGAQPYGAAKPNPQGKPGGHWAERFQGTGNVTNSRCQGMSRGANCITPETRKDAARRAAAARAAAQEGTTVPASATGGSGGK